MRIWLLFLIFGKVFLVHGPMEPSLEHCEIYAEYAQQQIRENFKPREYYGKVILAKDIEVSCITANFRPAPEILLGPPEPQRYTPPPRRVPIKK